MSSRRTIPRAPSPPARPWLDPGRVAVILSGFWIVDALLQLQPSMFTAAFPVQILYNAALMYQPPGLRGFLFGVAHQEAAHERLLTVAIAAVQLLLAAGLIWGRTRRPALLASAAWAGAIWVGGEGLGFLFTGAALAEAGAPGSALLYLAISLLALGGLERGCFSWRATRAVWSSYWGLAAILHIPVRFGPGAVLAYNLQTAAQAEPSRLGAFDYRLAQLGFAWGAEISVALALLETALAIAVWSPSWRRPALLLGVGVSLVFWVLGQAMGGVLSGLATDPNSGPLVALLGLLGLGAATGAGRRWPAWAQKKGPTAICMGEMRG